MILAIIQARFNSSRLPGKILKEISGKPLLAHVIERVKLSGQVSKVILATTVHPNDNATCDQAQKCGVDCFRGNEEDVLDRYYSAAKRYNGESILRVTADCPLIDPEITDRIIEKYLEGGLDYVSNTIEPTFPDGLDSEVFSFKALEKAWKEAKKLSEREHVTPYLWNHPQNFRIKNVAYEKNLSGLRWTVDTKEDLEFVKEVYKDLYREGQIFYMRDVLHLMERRPELLKINRHPVRNEGYLHSLSKDNVNRAP